MSDFIIKMRNRKGPKSTQYLPPEICTLPKDSLQPQTIQPANHKCEQTFAQSGVPRAISLKKWALHGTGLRGDPAPRGEQSRAVPTLWMRKRQSATTCAHHLAPAPQVQLHDVIRHRSNITATLYAPLGGTICGGTTVALRWKPVEIHKCKVTLWAFGERVQPAQKYRYVLLKHWNNTSGNNIHVRMDMDLERPVLFSSQPIMPKH